MGACKDWNNIPAAVNIQVYVTLIAKGRFNEALELIRCDLLLPAVYGRVCTHPCELVNKRQELDESISLAALKRFFTDQEGFKPEKLPIFVSN